MTKLEERVDLDGSKVAARSCVGEVQLATSQAPRPRVNYERAGREGKERLKLF